nr:Gfo/Idh/MocA family oxidoreductase [Caldilineaceae bacterium]
MTDLHVDWRVKLGAKTDYGIGSIGCGGIVQQAHMPAYRKAGFNIVAVYDVNGETAAKVAQEFDIPKVYTSLDAFLADPEIEVVDIAVPPWVQLGVVEQVVAAGKHMLCQKPLADTLASAIRIVE